ncbi:MAG: YbaB/EbfC family nucleoid-associated protein [Bifidobacteriaceae bacterium]|jgi:hypothetical protein|nr:YbaB/EbfC family nucleoid-associated protein [Bifidobacteriaceae bacterium]
MSEPQLDGARDEALREIASWNERTEATARRMRESSAALAGVSGTGTSPGREVTVTVGQNGVVSGVKFGPAAIGQTSLRLNQAVLQAQEKALRSLKDGVREATAASADPESDLTERMAAATLNEIGPEA